MKFRYLPVLILALASLPAMTAVRDEIPVAPELPVPAQAPAKPSGPSAEAVSRGRMLYENHCTRCHTSVLHVRDNRRAVSLKVLEGWVRRWSGEEKLGWSEEEIVEVVDYLNRRYYKLPLPGVKK